MNININNFEDFVDNRILDRGKTYLSDDAILELEELENKDFIALISGTEVYSVNIVLNSKNEIFTHLCDCPYDFGPICKHKVAVLLKIRSHLKHNLPFQKGKLREIKFALKKYKKEELQQLLLNLAKSNFSTRNSILDQLGIEHDKEYEL